jgi:hypothetical protein
MVKSNTNNGNEMNLIDITDLTDAELDALLSTPNTTDVTDMTDAEFSALIGDTIVAVAVEDTTNGRTFWARANGGYNFGSVSAVAEVLDSVGNEDPNRYYWVVEVPSDFFFNRCGAQVSAVKRAKHLAHRNDMKNWQDVACAQF